MPLDLPEKKYSSSLTFQYDGDFIHYEKIGEGEKSLVFLHGFAMSLHAWDDIRDKFPMKRYTLYLVDLKGCGFSSKLNEGDYSLARQCGILYAWMQSLFIHSPVIIGHSYGGLVALAFYYHLRKKKWDISPSKLILLDAPAYPEHIPVFLKLLKNPLLGYISLKMVSPGWNAKLIIRMTFFHHEEAVHRLYDRYRFFLELEGTDDAMLLMAKQVIPDDLDEMVKSYKDIDIPVLVLWGENDELIPLKYGKKLAADIPHASLQLIPECGHVPHEECPDDTYTRIMAFLEA